MALIGGSEIVIRQHDLAEFDDVTGDIRLVLQRYCRTLGVDVPKLDEEQVANLAFDNIKAWQRQNDMQSRISLPTEKREQIER